MAAPTSVVITYDSTSGLWYWLDSNNDVGPLEAQVGAYRSAQRAYPFLTPTYGAGPTPPATFALNVTPSGGDVLAYDATNNIWKPTNDPVLDDVTFDAATFTSAITATTATFSGGVTATAQTTLSTLALTTSTQSGGMTVNAQSTLTSVTATGTASFTGGSVIGATSVSLIGFWGHAPVAQQGSTVASSTGIIAKLVAAGILAS